MADLLSQVGAFEGVADRVPRQARNHVRHMAGSRLVSWPERREARCDRNPAGPRGTMANIVRPREFCQLERELVQRMTMRKKRQVAMGPVQALKLRLLDEVDAADPEPDAFNAAVARAVVVVSDGGATGPAQAVASDLEMDWQLARSSAGFVAWLRAEGGVHSRGSSGTELT